MGQAEGRNPLTMGLHQVGHLRKASCAVSRGVLLSSQGVSAVYQRKGFVRSVQSLGHGFVVTDWNTIQPGHGCAVTDWNTAQPLGHGCAVTDWSPRMLKIRALRSGLCHYRDMHVEPRPGFGCVIILIGAPQILMREESSWISP